MCMIADIMKPYAGFHLPCEGLNELELRWLGGNNFGLEFWNKKLTMNSKTPSQKSGSSIWRHRRNTACWGDKQSSQSFTALFNTQTPRQS